MVREDFSFVIKRYFKMVSTMTWRKWFSSQEKIACMNIQPYYVYQHDMVPGCEHFRTTLGEAVEMARAVRGTTGRV